MKRIRVGIAGLGVVGSEAVRLMDDCREGFAERTGILLEIAAVCDRRVDMKARALKLKKSVRRTRSHEQLSADPSLDIVVETMGGLQEARRFVLASLKSGKHVITANKRLLAGCWDEVMNAAGAASRAVRFEASVAGGIPILAALDTSLAANRIERVYGILNGTTNFILSRMVHLGETVETALKEAQRLGLAEADPRMDLDGSDSAHKVSVIASMLTGRWLDPALIDKQGIGHITPEDISYCIKELGHTIRLLAAVAVDWKGEPKVSASVGPTLVPVQHPLAAVHDEYNAILVQASAAGDLMFYGKGAGAGPAGSAIVGDVLDLSREITQGQAGPRFVGSDPLKIAPEPAGCYYFRLEVPDRAGVLARIAGTLGAKGISIARVHQGPSSKSGYATVFITTAPAEAKAIKIAAATLKGTSRGFAHFRIL